MRGRDAVRGYAGTLPAALPSLSCSPPSEVPPSCGKGQQRMGWCCRGIQAGALGTESRRGRDQGEAPFW